MAHAPNRDERFMLMELPSGRYRAVSRVIDGYSAELSMWSQRDDRGSRTFRQLDSNPDL
jgi:hypothetical protein